MVRRSLILGLAALLLATPAMAQRHGYQDAPQSRSGRDHYRGNGGNDGGRGDRGNGRYDRNDRNDRTDSRSEPSWRQRPDPRQEEARSPPPDGRYGRSQSSDRQRFQDRDQGQRPPERSPERPSERPREVQLTDILRNLRGQYGGQHLDAQRSGENYVIPWLSRDGRRMTVVVDAATGRVISVR
jgi:hypothetical protein